MGELPTPITNPIGFRIATQGLVEQFDTLNATEAATLADQLASASPKACRGCAVDDLEDLQVVYDALKNRIRRRWKRQRSRNIYGTALAFGLGALAMQLRTAMGNTPGESPWPLIVLLCVNVFVVLFTAQSIAESTDWREDVGKPVDRVAETIAKALAERPDAASAAYRGSTVDPRVSSTGVRVDRSIPADADLPREGVAARGDAAASEERNGR